jgi:hypothetical protein
MPHDPQHIADLRRNFIESPLAALSPQSTVINQPPSADPNNPSGLDLSSINQATQPFINGLNPTGPVQESGFISQARDFGRNVASTVSGLRNPLTVTANKFGQGFAQGAGPNGANNFSSTARGIAGGFGAVGDSIGNRFTGAVQSGLDSALGTPEERAGLEAVAREQSGITNGKAQAELDARDLRAKAANSSFKSNKLGEANKLTNEELIASDPQLQGRLAFLSQNLGLEGGIDGLKFNQGLSSNGDVVLSGSNREDGKANIFVGKSTIKKQPSQTLTKAANAAYDNVILAGPQLDSDGRREDTASLLKRAEIASLPILRELEARASSNSPTDLRAILGSRKTLSQSAVLGDKRQAFQGKIKEKTKFKAKPDKNALRNSIDDFLNGTPLPEGSDPKFVKAQLRKAALTTPALALNLDLSPSVQKLITPETTAADLINFVQAPERKLRILEAVNVVASRSREALDDPDTFNGSFVGTKPNPSTGLLSSIFQGDTINEQTGNTFDLGDLEDLRGITGAELTLAQQQQLNSIRDKRRTEAGVR